MKRILITALVFLLIGANQLFSQDTTTTAVTVQEGTIAAQACDNTNLPADIWTLIRYDNAGEPCATSAVPGSCTPNTWNWEIDGHFAFTNAPGYRKVRVRVQVWAGGGGGACYGGTSEPIYCDNQYYKLVKQDDTVESDIPNTDLMVPFTSLEYLLAPYFQVPSDANYQGLWIFAMPIGRPAICREIDFHDIGAN